MKGYIYLATPYTNYPGGIDAAFEMAAKTAGIFMKHGFPIFSPIAHSHPVAKFGEIDPLDHEIWMKSDSPMMQAAAGLLVYCAPSWRESRGVAHEIMFFRVMEKPIAFWWPEDFEKTGMFERCLRFFEAPTFNGEKV